MPVIKIAQVKQKETFQQPLRSTYYNPKRPESQRLLTTSLYKAGSSHVVGSTLRSALGSPGVLLFKSSTSLVSVPSEVSTLWSSWLEKVSRCFFLQVLEEIFASALGTPYLPLLCFLTLFESRCCAFSFYPAIILMISWCPVPSREAMCGTCMLYAAVEVCQMHIEGLGNSVVIRSVLGAQ